MKKPDVEFYKKPILSVIVILCVFIALSGIAENKKNSDEVTAKKAKDFGELPKPHQKKTFENCLSTGLYAKSKQGYSEVRDCSSVDLVKEIM